MARFSQLITLEPLFNRLQKTVDFTQPICEHRWLLLPVLSDSLIRITCSVPVLQSGQFQFRRLGASDAMSGIRTDANADSSLRLSAKMPHEKTINYRANVNKIEACGGGDTIE